MKKCKTCNVEKPLSEFYSKKESKDKLSYDCKTCRLSEIKKYREKHPDRIKKSNKAAYLKNRKQRIAAQKEYSANNKESISAYRKRWREINADHTRSYDLKKKYGLTVDDLERMIMSQGNKCDICAKQFSEKVKMNIDHCHTTGKVRSLLCSRCNTAIGLVFENVEIMNSMINYIKSHAKAL